MPPMPASLLSRATCELTSTSSTKISISTWVPQRRCLRCMGVDALLPNMLFFPLLNTCAYVSRHLAPLAFPPSLRQPLWQTSGFLEIPPHVQCILQCHGLTYMHPPNNGGTGIVILSRKNYRDGLGTKEGGLMCKATNVHGQLKAAWQRCAPRSRQGEVCMPHAVLRSSQ